MEQNHVLECNSYLKAIVDFQSKSLEIPLAYRNYFLIHLYSLELEVFKERGALLSKMAKLNEIYKMAYDAKLASELKTAEMLE